MGKKRLRSDLASGTLVTGIISMLFLLLCAGMAIDVTKNSYLKSSFSAMSQNAAQTAVKSVNEVGSLTDQAPHMLVTEYLRQKGSEYDNSAVGAGVHYDETTAYQSPGCSTRTVTSWDGGEVEAALPYIVMRFDTGRQVGTGTGSAVYVSEGGGDPQLVSGSWNPNLKYTVVAAEISDSSNNVMLGSFGVPCQDYRNLVSAITFGSNEDL